MVEHVGRKDPAAARNKQRRPVLLKQHCILEVVRRHMGVFVNDIASAEGHRRQ